MNTVIRMTILGVIYIFLLSGITKTPEEAQLIVGIAAIIIAFVAVVVVFNAPPKP